VSPSTSRNAPGFSDKQTIREIRKIADTSPTVVVSYPDAGSEIADNIMPLSGHKKVKKRKRNIKKESLSRSPPPFDI
jgi:hypothetical protein